MLTARIATTLGLLAVLAPATRAFAAPCPGAVPYAGPTLHAPPGAGQFPTSGEVVSSGRREAAFDTATVRRLDAVIARALEKLPTPGITAAVVRPGVGAWSATRGLAATEPRTAATESTAFGWASVGKTWTSVVVRQLVAEGKLALDAPLARWFPEFPNARAITIDHLLTHTSGLYSFQEDEAFRARAGYSPPESLLAVALRHPPRHCPGEAWAYTNTGYVLLARIIERVEERPFHEVANARIARPLGLVHTRVLAPATRPPDLATGHREGAPDRSFDPSMPFGAGAVVGTAPEMLRFWSEVLRAERGGTALMSPAYGRLYPMFGSSDQSYGRGVMLYDVAEGPSRLTWLGHSGGTESYRAVIAWDANVRAWIAVAMNGPAPAEAVANALLKALEAPK